MPTDQFTYGLPIRELLLVGLVAAVVTLLLTGPVRMLALKVGAVAWPRGRDVHVTPTPRWGGLAMFGGVLAGLLLSLQLPALRLAYFEQSTEVVGVVVATGLLVGVGMLDDRYDLDALTKFAAQVTAAGLLVLYGVQWVSIWIPIGGDAFLTGSTLFLGQGQSVLLTVLVTVVLVNAMNFVDGLDGLAAGIGLITTLATAVFCVGLISENGNDPTAFVPALLAVVLAGSCLGFLPHNFHPARIFMGDTGSMMVGVMLSAAITTASGRVPQSDNLSAGNILALVSPVIVLVGIVFIPSLDLLMAVVRRTRAGTSPFSPDKMHLHHRLLQVGHSHRRAVLLVYLWVAVIAFGAVALALVPRTGLVLAATGIALVVAFVASAVPHRSRMRTAASAAPVAAGETTIASTDDLPDAGPGRRAPPARPSAG
ncbi:glycosyltransferase family 4 protein, partial [Pseudonocardia sp. McavD-2-B]|uniref:glycosyltransferase family 4 protein n=1 Tax=Pseudonocardia sp. McavD-2-B TaxID=2954499 RepID=UPI0020973AB1